MIFAHARSRVVSIGAALSLSLAAASSSATPNFPSAIASYLRLASAPDCTLCHVGPTQRGTVTTPFGKSMLAHGLVAYDETSLRNGLDALNAEKTDSDGDGAPDISELRAGTDPNAASASGTIAGAVPADEPHYGCGAQITPSAGKCGLASFLPMGLLCLGFGVRRMSGRPAPERLKTAAVRALRRS
jgi:hypothetical protein